MTDKLTVIELEADFLFNDYSDELKKKCLDPGDYTSTFNIFKNEKDLVHLRIKNSFLDSEIKSKRGFVVEIINDKSDEKLVNLVVLKQEDGYVHLKIERFEL